MLFLYQWRTWGEDPPFPQGKKRKGIRNGKWDKRRTNEKRKQKERERKSKGK